MENYQTKNVNLKKSRYDFIGALSSSLCMIHCLVTPFLFAAHATCSVTCSEISPIWWKTIDCLFLIVSLFAILHTAKNTSLKYMPILLCFSWLLLTVLIINNLLHIFNIPHALIYIPAIALTILHIYNRKYCTCKANECCVIN